MKVLFAVSSESISEAIIKRYQKEYKEILSYKNVYYFNAILKEIQKDKTYDRIIISEDLEPFSNNNYDTIDKFIFEKLDSISDEAQDSQGKDTSIILICTDRRIKGSSILVKLFGIGVYNALLGNDRSMDEVCKLINRPRSKKEAKIYYRIDADDVNYKAENENEVSEVEIQNILAHFKKLGKNSSKYSESFNNIAAQYTDEQLRIIVNCLPINVKAVLEAECDRYQELMAVTGKIASVKSVIGPNGVEGVAKNEISQRSIGRAENMSRPIVIPSAVRNVKNSAGSILKKPTQAPAQEKPKVVQKPQPAEATQNVAKEATRPVRPEAQAQRTIPRPVQNVVKPAKPEPIVEDDIIDEDILPGLDDLEEVAPTTPVAKPVSKPVAQEDDDLGLDMLPGLEETDELEDTLPGLEDEASVDDLSLADDDVLPGFEEVDDLEDTALPGLDDLDVEDDELVPTGENPDPLSNKDMGIPGYDDVGFDVDDGIEDDLDLDDEPKRGRGRPRKTPVGGAVLKPKGKRGRPRKTPEGMDVLDDDATLPGLDDLSSEADDVLPGFEEIDEVEDTLPGFEDEVQVDDLSSADDVLPGFEEVDETEDLLPGFEDNLESADDDLLPGFEDEAQVDDLSSADDVLPGFDEIEEVEDTALPGLDDLDTDLGSAEDDLGLDDDFGIAEIDDTLDNTATDDLSLGLDDLEEAAPAPVAEDVIEDASLDDLGDLGDYEEVVEDDGMLADVEYDELGEEDYTDEVALPGLDDLDDDLADVEEFEADDLGLEDTYEEVEAEDDLLPGMNSTQQYAEEEEEETLLPGMGFEDEEDTMIPQRPMPNQMESNSLESIRPKVDYSMSSLNSLITKDKKIVTFIGTSKNGNSFLVNNLAALFSSLGINTAILDMTKNKNSYFIFTKNEEELRTVAYNSIEKLQNGYAEGVKVDKNLTVYTDVPASGKDYSNAEPILSTLVQNHSLILIDCDYDTDATYFASCQEMYLVQSMDILTIQPLTAFLRELKTKGVLEPEKIRVVINKEMKIHKKVGDKDIIGGLAYYNDPAMSFMTELFNKDTVKAISIPFDPNAYARYLGGIVDCEVSLNGYSKQFLSKLKLLGDMVYPLTSKQSYSNKAATDYNPNAFSNSMNDTLSKMRKKY